MLLTFVSCSGLSDNTYTSFYFSTLISFNAAKSNKDDSAKAWDEMQAKLGDLENKLSVYKEGSDVDKFNKAQPLTHVEISKDTYDVLSFAKEIYVSTNGAYNPALYLLSDLWGFTDRFQQSYAPSKEYDRQDPTKELPNDMYITGFLTLSDFSQVEIYKDGDKFFAIKPNLTWVSGSTTYTMQLDLGGIVKGFASAYLANIAKNSSIDYGYLSLGSSSIVLLQRNKSNDLWDLKLKDPKDTTKFYLSVEIINAFVSTSGNYEQYYEIEGKRYCHIINPYTGYPIENTTMSTSCVMPFEEDMLKSATFSDAISTALMVMDYQDAIKYLKDNSILGSIAAKLDGKDKVFTNIQNARILGEYEAYEG